MENKILLGSLVGLSTVLLLKSTSSLFKLLKTKGESSNTPTTLSELGYTFSNEGNLVDVHTSEPYVFKDNLEYDIICKLMIEHVQNLMRKSFEEVLLPEEPVVNVFIKNRNYSKQLLIIQNTGRERAGVWSCLMTIKNGLSDGSMMGYTDYATELNYSVIISNPNEAEGNDSYTKKFKNSVKHIDQVYDLLIKDNDKLDDLLIIATGSGGRLALHLLKSKEKILKRLRGIAFVDSHHSVTDLEQFQNDKIEFLKNSTKHWKASHTPLGTPLKDSSFCGSPCVSGGSERTGWSIVTAKDAIFEFLEQQVHHSA